MELNVLVCYRFATNDNTSGTGNIPAYMAEISLTEIRDVERQIKEKHGLRSVTITNVIEFRKL